MIKMANENKWQIIRRIRESFSRIRTDKKEDDIESDKHGALVEGLLNLVKVVNRIRKEGEAQKEKIRNVVMNPELLRIHSEEWQRLTKITAMLEKIQNEPAKFMSEKELYVQYLKQNGEKDIAELVNRINIANGERLKILKEAIILVLKYRRGLVNLKEFDKTISEIISSIEKQEAASKEEQLSKNEAIGILNEIMNKVVETELGYLKAYFEELKIMYELAQRGKIRMDFFVARIKEYLQGAGSEPIYRKDSIQGIVKSQDTIKGVVTIFKDIRLGNKIQEDDAIKNLTTYPQQLVFIKELWQALMLILKDPTWKAEFTAPDGRKESLPFLGPKGFFHKIPEYCDLIEKHFGNRDFAARLRLAKEKTGEQPKYFEKLFENELKRLYGIMHDSMEQAKVVVAGIQALNKIFTERIGQLDNIEQKELTREAHKLADHIRQISDIESAKKALIRRVGKKKLTLENELIEVRKEFIKEEENVAVGLGTYIQETDAILLDLNRFKDKDITEEAISTEASVISDLRNVFSKPEMREGDPEKMLQALGGNYGIEGHGVILNEIRGKVSDYVYEMEEIAAAKLNEVRAQIVKGERLLEEYKVFGIIRQKAEAKLRIKDIQQIEVQSDDETEEKVSSDKVNAGKTEPVNKNNPELSRAR